MERDRKALLVRSVLAALIAFIIGVGAANVVLVPRMVKRHITRVASRSGFEIQAGRVSLRGVWVRVEDVLICSAGCGVNDPMVATVDVLRVKPSIRSLIGGRLEGSIVDLSGVRARVDLSRQDALDKIEAIDRKGRSAGGSKGGSGVGGPSVGTAGLPVALRGDGIDVDIVLPGGASIEVRGGRIMPGDGGAPPTIDLGSVDGDLGGIAFNARHLLIELTGPGEAGLIRSVRVLSPSIEVSEFDWDDAGSVTQDEANLDPTLGGDAGDDGVRALAGKLESAIAMARIPARMMGIFPKPIIEWNGGSLVIPEADGGKGLRLTKLRGSIEAAADGTLSRIEASGDADSGPFTAIIGIEATRLVFDVETPYVPVGALASSLGLDTGLLDLESARVYLECRGTLNRSEGSLALDGVVGGDGIVIRSDRLALEPVRNVHFRLDGHLEVDPGSMTMVVGESSLDACGIPLKLSEARLERQKEGYRIAARGLLVATSCQALFEALPFEMRSSLPGFRFAGELGSSFQVDLDWSHPEDAVLDFTVDNRCSVLSGGDLALDKFGHQFVHAVKDKLGEHEFVMGPGSDSWVNLEEIAPDMPKAIVTTEDGAFYKHQGISLSAIKRAAIKNMKAGYFAHGASTISMQLVKNLFLSRDKTLARKLQEMILTWWVENSMEKDQILELYLNVVEFGPAIYGIRNASLHYFGKEPADLTLLECAYLSKMLPNPIARYKYYEAGGLDDAWRAVLERVVTKMYERGYITEEEWRAALASEFEFYYPASGKTADMADGLETKEDAPENPGA